MASILIRALSALVLIFVAVGYSRLRYYVGFLKLRRQTGVVRPPLYPHKEPIFGYDLYRQRRQALSAGQHMKLYMRDFRRLGKTWEEIALTKRVINTMDPVNHQHIYTVGMDDFIRQPRPSVNLPLLGTGILMLDGERWRRSRSIIKPIFARAEVGNMKFLAKHVDLLLEMIPGDGSTFDIAPLIKSMTVDLSSEFLLGESFGALEGNPKAKTFLETFDEVLLGWNKRRQAGILHFRYIFDRKWPVALQRLYNMIDNYVEQALIQVDSEQNKQPNKNGYQQLNPSPVDSAQPSRAILLFELLKHVRDPEAIRFEIINIFIGSRDGPSALMGNMLWLLARHPSIWQELRQCVGSVNIDIDDPPPVAITNLASLRPFRYVLYETLRAIGPAARNLRKARHNTTLPRGGGPDGSLPIFVAKDTTVCTVTWGLHHDPEVWGDDVEEFRPERWAGFEDTGTGSTGRPPWTFVPFLGGPHVCPGQQQVIIQATYLLYRLVKKFDSIECRDEVLDYIELQRMVVESKRGVQIALIADKEN